MKNQMNICYILVLIIAMGIAGCNDSFLDRYPETSMNEGSFFASAGDLELYTNGFYGIIPASITDVVSDNILSTADSYTYSLLRGEITPQNVGSWSYYWSTIRRINFLLQNASKAVGKSDDIKHYVGIARFFRAYVYYEMVKEYSDVPWFNHALTTSDPELYKTQDSRALVVDSIMADLNYAAVNIKDGTSKTRITKWTALAGLARIALHEGTTRKYHKELGLNDYSRFLQAARDASLQIMNSGKFSIYKTNGSAPHTQAYESLFNSPDLSKNPEMIMIAAYDINQSVGFSFKGVFNNTSGLSRDLMEDYLALNTNGDAIPFHDVPGYGTMTFLNVFKNRDPRLIQTFMQPGYIAPGSDNPTVPKPEIGYVQEKFYPLTSDQIQLGGGSGYNDIPIYRLAETYLILAEAKAELGELNQTDLDQTINILRDRAHMPHAILSNWMANVDSRLSGHYPNVQGSMKGAVLEIRRERRVELACEGFRWSDLMRWGVGSLINNTPQGCYIPDLGYFDYTGDGVPDIFISKTKADFGSVTDKRIIKYSLDDALFSLSNGTNGYVQLKSQLNKYNFVEPKYYYKPVYDQDILINPKLIQNTFWK